MLGCTASGARSAELSNEVERKNDNEGQTGVGVWGLLVPTKNIATLKIILIFAGMRTAKDILALKLQEYKEDRMSAIPDLPKIEISESEKKDFYNKFGKSAAMLQFLNLYDEINLLTKQLIASVDDKEIRRIGTKLDALNKIVGLYKNASDTVNKMGVSQGVKTVEEESDESGDINVDGIDIKIMR